MTKILIDARMYGLENSGIGRYLINLIDNLQEIDHINHYIILLTKKYYDALEFKSGWKKVGANFRHYSLEEQMKLPVLIKQENPDLVHFPHINIPYFWKGKYIVTVHDLTMQRQGVNATTLPIPLYLSKRIPFLLIAQKCVKNATSVIVPTNYVKKDLCDYYRLNPDTVKVIYEGVELKFTDAKTSVVEKYNLVNPYFVYVGNYYPHKNVESLVKAIVLLNKITDKKVDLILGGSRNAFSKNIEKEIAKNNASKFVKFVGYVSDEDLSTLYNQSLAFVYPSLSEGFGLQGLEAMLSKTLLLASDIEVFKEIYGSCAGFFDPRNVTGIVEAMRGVLDMSPEQRNRLIAKSAKFAKKYSWKKMAEETLSLYEKA